VKKFFLTLTLLVPWACAPTDETLVFSGQTMGTTYAVNISRIPPETSRSEVQNVISNALSAISSAMSTYDEATEISRFNRQQTTDWIPITPPLHSVLTAALQIAEISEGAFDITAAPLVNAWGFGPGDRQTKPPHRARIQALLRHVGHRKIELRGPPYEARKLDPQATIDLSAIAKGYGVDHVSAELAALGTRDFLVEIGGEIRAQGMRDGKSPWRIGMEKPVPEKREVDRTLELLDAAIATSGDYRNFYELNGNRYSHVIDPRTGYPIKHELALVSVIADSTMIADAWATALLVLGPQDGYRVARANGIAARFAVRQGKGFSEMTTPAFNAIVAGL
jgi:thiamine biosynthesis lipoprotein